MFGFLRSFRCSTDLCLFRRYHYFFAPPLTQVKKGLIEKYSWGKKGNEKGQIGGHSNVDSSKTATSFPTFFYHRIVLQLSFFLHEIKN